MRADKIKNIFRQLRWKLTLSYTMVTMSAFLVVMLIMGGMIFTQIFIPNNILGPIGLIEIISKNSTPLWSHVLSQSPVDTDLINLLLKESDATITGNDFLRLGDVQFTVKTVARLRALIIGADGILLGKTAPGFSPNFVVGQPLDPQQIQGLDVPLNAALAGETDSERLYTIIEPNQRFILAVPVFNPSVEEENRVVGVIVAIFDSFPTQGDVPSNILGLAGRSLLIFLLGTGIMGAIFGAIIANGLATRFKRLSTTTDAYGR